MLNMPMSATVTIRLTSAPSVNLPPPNEPRKAACSTRSMARPPSTMMNSLGAASIRPVKVGASRPNRTPKSPKVSAAVYWRSILPEEVISALLGPVRQVLTAPTIALKNAPTPHATAIALTGGSCWAPLSTAVPWPFCTTSTVIASGTTSSTSAPSDHTGACTTGWAKARLPSVEVSTRPSAPISSAPISKAPITGGMRFAHAGLADSSRKAMIIGAAIATSLSSARTMSSPKRRNTPATMPITIGIGSADITRLTQPLAPITSTSRLVA